MPKFIFSYRYAKGRDPFADPSELAAWEAFLNDVVSPNVVDPGWPVFEPSTTVLGVAGESTHVGGYSVVTGDDREMAVSMAGRCPNIGRGGGVEVGELAELPPEHPAEQMRAGLSRA